MSHASTVQAADAKAEARLLKLLGKDTDWLASQRYNLGTAWLAAHYGYDPGLERALSAMPAQQDGGHNLFWSWWLNDWRHRDALMSTNLRVLPDTTAVYNRGNGVLTVVRDQDALLTWYEELHNPKNMQVTLPGFISASAKSWLRIAPPEEQDFTL